VDVVLQLFVGVHNENLEYVDEWHVVVTRAMLSVKGFWFDCVTSFPCSLVDLSHYLVKKQQHPFRIT
jgi:hypothetical protein